MTAPGIGHRVHPGGAAGVRAAMTTVEQVREFLDKQKVSEIYSAEQIKDIEAKLVANCERNPREMETWLKGVEKIIGERREASLHYKNVKRQEHEIRTYEIKPATVNTEKMVEQMRGMMPVESQNQRWRERHQGYGDGVPLFPGSVIGGSRSEIDWVKDNGIARMHSSMPPKGYRNVVFDAKVECLDEIRVADKKMQVFLNEGRETITPEERKSVTRRNVARHVASNIGEYGLDKVLNVVNWAGKGIISHSKANEDRRFEKFLDKSNALTAQLMWKLGPNARNGTSYLRALESANKRLSDAGLLTHEGIMGEVQFEAMQQIIAKAMEEAEIASKADLEEHDKKLRDIYSDMLKGTKDLVTTEDDMRKWRVLQLVLLFSPFSAALAFMNPLTQLLGPIFDSTLSFGQGLGSILSSPILGPFGQIAKAFHLDEAVTYLADHVPIVSDVGEVFKYVSNSDIMQNLGGVISPSITGSPLIYIAAASLYSLQRADEEIQHFSKSNKFTSDKEADLKKRFNELREKIMGVPLKERIQGFAAQEMATMLSAKQVSSLCEFISKADKKELAIFNGLQITDQDGNQKSLAQIMEDRGNRITPSQAFHLLQNSPEVRQNLVDRFLVYEGVGEDLDKFKLKSQSPELRQFVTEQRKKFSQDFIIDLAENTYHFKSHGDDEQKATFYQKQIMEAKVNHYYGMEKMGQPSGVVSGATATQLGAAAVRSRL